MTTELFILYLSLKFLIILFPHLKTNHSNFLDNWTFIDTTILYCLFVLFNSKKHGTTYNIFLSSKSLPDENKKEWIENDQNNNLQILSSPLIFSKKKLPSLHYFNNLSCKDFANKDCHKQENLYYSCRIPLPVKWPIFCYFCVLMHLSAINVGSYTTLLQFELKGVFITL